MSRPIQASPAEPGPAGPNAVFAQGASVSAMATFLPSGVRAERGFGGLMIRRDRFDQALVREAGEVAQLVKDLRTRKGPVFRLVKVMVEKLEFVMPPQDGAHLKDRFRAALLGRA